MYVQTNIPIFVKKDFRFVTYPNTPVVIAASILADCFKARMAFADFVDDVATERKYDPNFSVCTSNFVKGQYAAMLVFLVSSPEDFYTRLISAKRGPNPEKLARLLVAMSADGDVGTGVMTDEAVARYVCDMELELTEKDDFLGMAERRLSRIGTGSDALARALLKVPKSRISGFFQK